MMLVGAEGRGHPLPSVSARYIHMYEKYVSASEPIDQIE